MRLNLSPGCLLILLVFIQATCKTNSKSQPTPPVAIRVTYESRPSQIPGAVLQINSMDIGTVDIDKDGDPDIIIAAEFRPNIILLNDGKGKFTHAEAALPKKNTDSEDIAAGDFDKDGDTDLIFVSEDTKVHEYYLNNGNLSFTDASDRFAFNSTANAVTANDFDKDGDLDVIIGNDGQDFFLENDGRGNFTDMTTHRFPADSDVTQDVQEGDIDGDNDPDLVFGNEDGNKIYLNNGSGIFTRAAASALPPRATEETRKVDLADIDNDGDLDIFFSNVKFRPTSETGNRLLVNDGKGNFSDETALRFKGRNNYNTADANFHDPDKDGDQDLFLANVFNGQQQFFINNGAGIFEENNTLLPAGLPENVICIEITDYNKDGIEDIYYGVFRGVDVLLTGRRLD